jgi:hypothetical protein
MSPRLDRLDQQTLDFIGLIQPIQRSNLVSGGLPEKREPRKHADLFLYSLTSTNRLDQLDQLDRSNEYGRIRRQPRDPRSEQVGSQTGALRLGSVAALTSARRAVN